MLGGGKLEGCDRLAKNELFLIDYLGQSCKDFFTDRSVLTSKVQHGNRGQTANGGF
jgi:hypothetical protein